MIACASRALPGVTNRVPIVFITLGLRPKTDLIEFKSAPDATTQALQFDPGCTADMAALILEAMPPRPVQTVEMCESIQ